MLPEDFQRRSFVEAVMGKKVYPVFMMVKHNFIWVAYEDLFVFEPSSLFQMELDVKSSALASAYRAVIENGVPDLDYWRSRILAERLQARDGTRSDPEVVSPPQITPTSRKKVQRKEERYPVEPTPPPTPIVSRKRKPASAGIDTPSEVEDPRTAKSDAKPPSKKPRRSRRVLSTPPESDPEDDEEALSWSSSQHTNLSTQTPEPTAPPTSSVEVSAPARERHSPPTVDREPQSGSSEDVVMRSDGPLFEPDGGKVAFIIGEDSTPVRVPKSSVTKPELLHLTECMTWDDTLGWHITRPLYSAFTVARFHPIAEFLTHGDFSPKLLDDDDPKPRLDGVESITQKADALLDCGRAFNVAREVQLPEMMQLVVRKICVLRPWPAAEVLMVTNFVFHEPPTGLDADDDLRKLLCNHIAKDFWDINSTQAKNLRMMLTRYPELEENVLSARLEKLRSSTPDSGIGEDG
ncbi:hypothetical protein H2199_000442 [Coniosporium tulheliwenetii]|uniref:Uncharacterized protein n=1 Tax=Coniosporium tulheliwenetii TaxID=3383036 RepID=A0ACC2ZPX1_9PEZI|nr:hypothetical protein H2199_000442 [Cladosporium sp. JES 115]